MQGKRSKSRFWIRVIVTCLTCIIFFSLVPYKFQIQPVSALPNSPDNITISVQGGGDIVNQTKLVDNYYGFWGETFYYVTPSYNTITIEASTPAMDDLMHLSISTPDGDTIMENGTNKALSVAATTSFGEKGYTSASVAFDGDHSDGVSKYYHFYAKPEITELKLSSEKLSQFETLQITAKCKPAIYAEYGTFNLTLEGKGINYTRLPSTYDPTAGTFSIDICPRDILPDYDPVGEWIVTAQIDLIDFGPPGIEMEVWGSPLMTASLYRYFRVTSAVSTPTPYLPKYNIWTLTLEGGDVEVLLKSEGFVNWHYFEMGMQLTPEDSIRTGNSFKDFAVLKNSEGAEITLTKGAVLKVSDLSAVEVRQEAYAFDGLTLYGGESIYDTLEHPPAASKLRVQTPDAVITDSGTQFEVIVDEYGTHVRTFSGSVSVTDINSTLSVEVGENQTTSIRKGEFPNPPTLFDASAIDRWWEALASPAPKPVGFDLSNFTVLLPIIVIVAVIVVVVVAAVVWAMRRKPKTQALYPPPPPTSTYQKRLQMWFVTLGRRAC